LFSLWNSAKFNLFLIATWSWTWTLFCLREDFDVVFSFLNCFGVSPHRAMKWLWKLLGHATNEVLGQWFCSQDYLSVPEVPLNKVWMEITRLAYTCRPCVCCWSWFQKSGISCKRKSH
jgi:hypothetical protein